MKIKEDGFPDWEISCLGLVGLIVAMFLVPLGFMAVFVYLVNPVIRILWCLGGGSGCV